MNVLNKEYLQLEEQIQELSEKWSKSIEESSITSASHLSSIQHYPAIPQLNLAIDENQYKSFVTELFALLKELQPALEEDLKKITNALTSDVLKQWYKEAIAVNQFYFEKFAKDLQVAEWIPNFAAEHATRPYLQKASAEIAELLQKHEGFGGCPACGEPPRMAVINKKGKKEVTCPRCLFAWEVKKVQCAHCGSDEPGKLEIIKVEKDDRAEVHCCETCKGYTKVIDVRKLIKKEAIQLLDIKSIHLDFIAQENGYGVPEDKEAN